MADASFLDEVAADSHAKGGGSCSVGSLLLTLPDDLAESVRTALANPTFTGTAIQRALKAREYVVSDGAIQRHRRGACGCER